MRIIFIDSNPLIVKCWERHYQTCLDLLKQYNLSLLKEQQQHQQQHQHHQQQQHSLEFYATTIDDYIRTAKLNGTTSVVTPTNALSYMGGGFDKYLLQALLLSKDNTSTNSIINYKYLETIIQNQQMTRYHGYLIPNHIYKFNLLKDLPQTEEYNYQNTLAYQNLNIVELIQIPTMIVPEQISHSHIFEAIWSLFTHITQEEKEKEKKQEKEKEIEERQLKQQEQLEQLEKDQLLTRASTLSKHCNAHYTNSNQVNLIIPGLGTGYGKLNEYESAKMMIFAIFLYNLEFPQLRLGQLKKSVMIMFLFNKDYRLYKNHEDLQELETHIVSDYGKLVKLKQGNVMELDELFQCIQL